jgi:uncharacterized phage protein (TIGR02218 family)
VSRAFLDRELDTVATFWRIWRKDGVALGFTTHDRDLWFGGLLHRAAPGLTPSAIRRTAGFADEGADVEGALAHDCIAGADIAAGRYDGAMVAIGAVNWETLEAAILYRGTIENVGREGNAFTAELASAKAALAVDPVPRSSPACRARFCDAGCGLSPARFTRRVVFEGVTGSRTVFAGIESALYRGGELRWRDGSLAGLSAQVLAADETGLLLDCPTGAIEPGTQAFLREGCDHTIATCAARFGNAANFQGEPFLPGTDLLAHYPLPR